MTAKGGTMSMAKRHAARGGQSTAEYAVVIALVLGAVIGMQTYIKRAINAKLKQGADQVLPTSLLSKAPTGAKDAKGKDILRDVLQFEPDYTAGSFRKARSVINKAGTDINAPEPVKVTISGPPGGVSNVTTNGAYRSATIVEDSSQRETGIDPAAVQRKAKNIEGDTPVE